MQYVPKELLRVRQPSYFRKIWNWFSKMWNWISLVWNWISLVWNWISLVWNWISLVWNWTSLVWDWISFVWNWISFVWNWISFARNRPENGIVSYKVFFFRSHVSYCLLYFLILGWNNRLLAIFHESNLRFSSSVRRYPHKILLHSSKVTDTTKIGSGY